MISGARIVLALAFTTVAWTATAADAISAEEVRLLRDQVEQLSNRLAEVEAELEKRRESQSDAAPAPTPAERQDVPRLRVDERGVFLQSADEAHQLRIRTRLGLDFGWFDQDSHIRDTVGDEQDGVGFRWARLYLQGRLYHDFDYVFEIDFAGQGSSDSPAFRDVYLQYNGIPSLFDSEMALRVGHFREPFSLEVAGGIYDRMFVENSLASNFAPGRNTGVALTSTLLGEPGRERMHWTLGLYKQTGNIPSRADSDESQGWQFTGRVTGLPYYAQDGRRLLHLGAAYSYRTPRGALVRIGPRAESSLAQFRYVDTEGLPELFRLSDARVEEIRLLGLEAAGVWGPASLQGEYIHSDVRTTLGGNLNFSGWYAAGSYFLTGEHRPYSHSAAAFVRPRVRRPFGLRGENRGPGAWELTARHSRIDLSDGPIQAGEQRATTLGVNWYLNQNVRTMLNYSHNRIDHRWYDGTVEALTLRVAFDF